MTVRAHLIVKRSLLRRSSGFSLDFSTNWGKPHLESAASKVCDHDTMTEEHLVSSDTLPSFCSNSRVYLVLVLVFFGPSTKYKNADTYSALSSPSTRRDRPRCSSHDRRRGRSWSSRICQRPCLPAARNSSPRNCGLLGRSPSCTSSSRSRRLD